MYCSLVTWSLLLYLLNFWSLTLRTTPQTTRAGFEISAQVTSYSREELYNIRWPGSYLFHVQEKQTGSKYHKRSQGRNSNVLALHSCRAEANTFLKLYYQSDMVPSHPENLNLLQLGQAKITQPESGTQNYLSHAYHFKDSVKFTGVRNSICKENSKPQRKSDCKLTAN